MARRYPLHGVDDRRRDVTDRQVEHHERNTDGKAAPHRGRLLQHSQIGTQDGGGVIGGRWVSCHRRHHGDPRLADPEDKHQLSNVLPAGPPQLAAGGVGHRG